METLLAISEVLAPTPAPPDPYNGLDLTQIGCVCVRFRYVAHSCLHSHLIDAHSDVCPNDRTPERTRLFHAAELM